MPHERVVGREVEHVVLHDPGRHDEHRLGMHRAGGRRVLDQLHQPVAQHHPPRRDGHVAPRLVALGAGRRQVARLAPRVFQRVGHAAPQVHAALGHRALLHHRVQRDEVRRRHHVEPLARREAHHLLVMAVHARHSGRRALPPLLAQQEGLRDPSIRRQVPGRVVEALVLRHGLHDRLAGGRGAPCAQPLLGAVLHELPLLGGRAEQVHPPVHEGADRGAGRHRRTGHAAPHGELSLEPLPVVEGRRRHAVAAEPGACAALACAGRTNGNARAELGRRGRGNARRDGVSVHAPILVPAGCCAGCRVGLDPSSALRRINRARASRLRSAPCSLHWAGRARAGRPRLPPRA